MADSSDTKKRGDQSVSAKAAGMEAKRAFERRSADASRAKAAADRKAKGVGTVIDPRTDQSLRANLDKVREAEVKRHAQADKKRAFERSLDHAKKR